MLLEVGFFFISNAFCWAANYPKTLWLKTMIMKDNFLHILVDRRGLTGWFMKKAVRKVAAR
jgi:hypothetical protein